MNDLLKDKKMIIGIFILWGGLIVIGLVMTVMGILVLTGRMTGTKLMLPVGALVLIRSVIKVIGLKKQLDVLKEAAAHGSAASDSVNAAENEAGTETDKR